MSVEPVGTYVTPGVILAHVVLGGSLVSLYKGKASCLGSVTLMAGLGEAAIVLLWRYGTSSVSTLVAVAGVAGACYLYDRFVRIPGTVHRNVVFTSDSDLQEIIKNVNSAKCDVSRDNSGRHVVTTPFAYVRYSPTDWFWGSASTKVVDLDEVESVEEGCQSKVADAVKSVGAEVDQCLELVLREGATSVTVITSSAAERDDWLTALRRLFERRVGEQRSAWVSALYEEAAVGQGDERSVSLTQAVNTLTRVGRQINPHYGAAICHSILKSSGTKNGSTESVMSEDQFLQFYDLAAGRPQIKQIYDRLVTRLSGQYSLNGVAFYDFLRTEQKEKQLSVDDARNWIHQMEPVLLRSSCLSDIGFTSYMLDEKQNIFRRDLRHAYQDMTRPLSHYFIATSHNTYLTKDQLRSKSSVDAYTNVFKRGGKCVELDCWDGPSNEPIIYHGHTLTSKILFKDVIEAVRDHGFVVSQYPVILSLENHCSVEQQKVMAEHLKTILGNRLYTRPICDSATELPSPETLKGFVLVKNKKLKDGREDQDDDESSDDESTDENEEPDVNSNNASEVIEEVANKTSMSKMSKKRNDKDTEKQPKLASELSDLVVYCQAVHFKDFQHSKEQGRHYEMSSFSEKKATRFTKEDATSLIDYNRRQLSRIYPAGSRIDSSNFDPVQMWNAGCQLVALNYQTSTLPMQLNQGLFQDNGGCGYVLKPDILTEDNSTFDPRGPFDDNLCTFLMIRVLGGNQVPYRNEGSIKQDRGLLVQVRVTGVEADNQKEKTKTVKSTGLSVTWNEMVALKVHVPQLALVSFLVKDSADNLLAQYTLPMRCMTEGYRVVPLRSKSSEALAFASLLVHVELKGS